MERVGDAVGALVLTEVGLGVKKELKLLHHAYLLATQLLKRDQSIFFVSAT